MAALEERVTAVAERAGERAGELKQGFENYQPQGSSLEPYGKPADIRHGESLIVRATIDRDKARADYDEVLARKEKLTGELAMVDRLVTDIDVVRESLTAIVSPVPDREADPFPGMVEAARTKRDEVRETLNEATRLLDQATEQVRRTADGLAQHATDDKFEKVAAPVRRQMIATDRERLPDYAAEWEAAPCAQGSGCSPTS